MNSKSQVFKTFNGFSLVLSHLGQSENTFYRNFPGEVSSYSFGKYGEQKLFIRYINRPSRMLHPAEDCYRARGKKIARLEPKSIFIPEVFSKSITWSRFLIKENGKKYEILQSVVSQHNSTSYSEVYQWFWNSSFLSRDRGPWVSYTWKRPFRN